MASDEPLKPALHMRGNGAIPKGLGICSVHFQVGAFKLDDAVKSIKFTADADVARLVGW